MRDDRWVNWDGVFEAHNDPWNIADEIPDPVIIIQEHEASVQKKAEHRQRNIMPEDEFSRLGLTRGDVREMHLLELVLNYGLSHDKAVDLRHRAFAERKTVA